MKVYIYFLKYQIFLIASVKENIFELGIKMSSDKLSTQRNF